MTNLLNQRYRFIRPLKEGGMGKVSLAADTKLGDRLVAVKEMRQDKLISPEEVETAIQAFKQEAHMLAALRHQNLPRIYDHFEEAGNWYLVMDFIEGRSLEDYQKTLEEGKLPIGEFLKIGIQLCTVLHYLHTQQPHPIIFRDLKPSNIMRTPDGHIYLIDFGIARHFKQGQARDTFLAVSPGYTPPEQWPERHTKQTTPQSDIYSLGATFHHLLTGHHPKDNEQGVFAPLQSFNRSLPLALNTLIMWMVKEKADDRPVNILSVKQELQHIAAQRTTEPTKSLPSSVLSIMI